jgi:hypothetical protein
MPPVCRKHFGRKASQHFGTAFSRIQGELYLKAIILQPNNFANWASA